MGKLFTHVPLFCVKVQENDCRIPDIATGYIKLLSVLQHYSMNVINLVSCKSSVSNNVHSDYRISFITVCSNNRNQITDISTLSSLVVNI